MSLKRLLYTLFLYVIFPLVLIRLLWRSRSNSEYRKRWSERLGLFPNSIKAVKTTIDGPVLWLHAVSVGEVIAAKPLVYALLNEFPTYSLLITTTTPTGSDRVNEVFAEEIQSQKLIHVYFPYDLLGSVSRFIAFFDPKMLIVVETEIWPNLYAKCHQENIPIIMVNARLSHKSVNSYLKIKGLVSETLSKVNLIAVRSKVDAERFSSLGAIPGRIKEIGNIKYDLMIDQIQLKNAKKYLQVLNKGEITQRLVFVAASTHDGEDDKILIIYKNLLKQFSNLLLVLVPRHPERFTDVYHACLKQFPADSKVIKHSEFDQVSASRKQRMNVIIGDSMGEMQLWYSIADVVFIGGSLVKTGGHNPLEATIFGVPVFSGPHMFNFEDIASELVVEELLFIADDEFEITKGILKFLNNKNIVKAKNSSLKQRTGSFMQQHRGVTARLISHINNNLDQ